MIISFTTNWRQKWYLGIHSCPHDADGLRFSQTNHVLLHELVSSVCMIPHVVYFTAMRLCQYFFSFSYVINSHERHKLGMKDSIFKPWSGPPRTSHQEVEYFDCCELGTSLLIWLDFCSMMLGCASSIRATALIPFSSVQWVLVLTFQISLVICFQGIVHPYSRELKICGTTRWLICYEMCFSPILLLCYVHLFQPTLSFLALLSDTYWGRRYSLIT